MRDKIDEYLKWKSTYAKRAGNVYKYTLRHLDKVETVQDIINFRYKLEEIYSPSHVAFSMSVLRDFIHFLWYKRETKLNPNLIKIPRFIPKRRIVVTAIEFEKMSAVWNENEFIQLRNKLIINLLWDTGVRVSELVEIKLADINENTAIIQTRKTTTERMIMWSKHTQKLLVKYLNLRMCLNTKEKLLVGEKEQFKITSRQIQRIIRETCIKCNMTKLITPHSFRHGKAHQVLERGGNVKEIASILGHSELNPRAAFQYLKLDNREQKSILHKFI